MSNSQFQHVPFSNLQAAHAEILPEALSLIENLVKRSEFIGGGAVSAFEKSFCDFCESRFAVGTSSGSSALKLALWAIGVGPGDEVITPANSFFATTAAIIAVGATPVLVDVDLDSALLSPTEAAKHITKKTKALLPVHLYGNPVDLEAFQSLAKQSGLSLLQDAAQAHGARWRDRPLSDFGNAEAYSFYPGKNLGAWGDAGAVVTRELTIYESVMSLRDYGRKSGEKYSHEDSRGGNERLDAIQAAILKLKLNRLSENNAKRRELFQQYFEGLSLIPEIKVIRGLPFAESVHHLLVIRCPEREKLKHHLLSLGIETGVHYPISLNQQPGLCHLSRKSLPNADRLAREVLSLPLFPEMTDSQVEYVVNGVKEFFR